VQPFVSKEAYLLWKLVTKGGEISTKISWEVGFGHGYGQRMSNIEELRRIKILGQGKHTSKGSKLINLIGCI
jgi:hypothetical protein